MTRCVPEDGEKAGVLLGAAIETASELGMPTANGMARQRMLELSAAAGVPRRTTVTIALRESPRPPAASRSATASPAPEALLRKEGDYWTIAHGGDVFRLRDRLGLRYLANLLPYPGREFLAFDLETMVDGRSGDASGTSITGGSPEAPERQKRLSHTGDLDRHAKAASEHRLRELREELAEATAFNDVGRLARAGVEIDFLLQQLASGLRLGERTRVACSPIERSRQNVTRTIKNAVRTIAENNPPLGHHLAVSVKTGTFCAYMPFPETTLRWSF